MFFCYLVFSLCLSKSDLKIRSMNCSSGNYYDPFSYYCVSLTKLFSTTSNLSLNSEYEIECTSGDPVCYAETGPICCPSDLTNYYKFGDVYVLESLLGASRTDYSISIAICNYTNKRHPKYCEFAANYCSAKLYKTSQCQQFIDLYKSNFANQYDYSYWTVDSPWIDYKLSLNSILDEQIVSLTPQYMGLISFQLAKYSLNGAFMGFVPLRSEFNICGEKNLVNQVWRISGSNYQSTCTVNFSDIYELDSLETDPNVFYEPFFQETNGILRPLPVIVFDSSVDSLPSSIRTLLPKRRFFKFYKQSTSLTYISSFSIFINLNEDKTSIETPYFVLQYKDTKTNGVTNTFEFQTEYILDASGIKTTAVVFLAIFGALSLAYFLYKAFIYVQHKGVDGIDTSVILGIVAELLHVIGVLVFTISFIFSFYIMAFFKWQNSVFLWLPTESDMAILSTYQWIAFISFSLSTIIKLIEQMRLDVFIVDWETPKKKGLPVSSWRRIMIANEWNRVLCVRCYNVPFTLICLLFILLGYDAQYMSTPVPFTDYINTGYTSTLLRFAYDSYLWIIFLFVQWVFNTYIRWNIMGNPFANFLDLCATANTSVLMMTSSSHGFYLHGRSSHSHADESMEKLNENLAAESTANSGLRGLLPNTHDQVFEIYLAPIFRNTFKQTFEMIQNKVRPKQIIGDKNFTLSSVSQEALSSFTHFNKFLCTFFDSSTPENPYSVRQAPFSQKYLGMAPALDNDTSLFLSEDDTEYKNGLLAGIEWTLALFYILLFTVIDVSTQSPAAAAFVVFIVDLILVKLGQKIGRANLAKKSLLDNRFILS